MTIVIIGAGSMGEIVAKSIPKTYKLIIVDEAFKRAWKVSRDTGAVAYINTGIVKKADCIILALPPDDTLPIVKKFSSLVKKNVILVNIATSINKEQIKSVIGNDAIIAGVKIIGQADGIKRGGEVIVVIDSDNEECQDILMEIFSPLGGIIFGDEKQFQAVNRITAEEMIKAAYKIQAKLIKMKIPEVVINTAVRTVATGTLMDFPWETPDYFTEKILKQIKGGN